MRDLNRVTRQLTNRRLFVFGRVFCLALIVACLSHCQASRQWQGNVVLPPKPMPEVSGTNWDGQPFRLSDQHGKVTILFFGYTYCPDVCPLALAKMKQLMAKLGSSASQVAVVFASVDPARDTVEKLSRYVPNFDPRFFGVHLDDLEATTEALDITVQFGQPKEGPGSDTFYYVDHTGSYFVVDRQGQLRLTFAPNASPELMLPDLERLLSS